MMRLEELQEYVVERYLHGLNVIETKIEADPELTTPTYYVVKTKETYVFGAENEADDKINSVRQLQGFESAKKTFKPGKVNKSGETVRDDMWVVVIVLKW